MTPLQTPHNLTKFIPINILAFVNRIRAILGAVPLESHKRTTFQSLPNELLLEIFSFLELKPYLISHGVCKEWRQLLPMAKLDSIRERLLNLYHRIIDTPDFQQTLEWTDQNLQPFDRKAYISSLLAQYPAIPDEYRIWILEWPERLVIQSTWPGLPLVNCRTISPVVRRSGVNWIAYEPTSPRLSALVYKIGTPSQMYIPGLFIWRYANSADWLIFEEHEPDLFGRVFVMQKEYHSMGSIPFYPTRESNEDMDTESRLSDGEMSLVTFYDWIDYLESLWDETAEEIRRPREMFSHRDRPVPRPVPCFFNGVGADNLPAPMWGSLTS